MDTAKACFSNGRCWGVFKTRRIPCVRVRVGFGPGMGGGGPMNPGQGQQENLEWDPDKVLGPAETGHLARRERDMLIKKDKRFGEALSMAETQEEKEKMVRRETRQVPKKPDELVEFFLDTNLDDMEFEVARCRPFLTKEFFDKLNDIIGETRFQAIDVDEDRLAELETLRDYLEGTSKAVDEAAQQTAGAVERFKKLMVSKDKKATILEMVAANEIDQALMDLMSQNVAMAREIMEDRKADFMEKLMKACQKYMIKTEDNKPGITPLMKTSRAGDSGEEGQGLYDPSAPGPQPDPNVLEILDPKSPKPESGNDEKKLIIDP